MSKHSIQLVLASNSPRRRQLLEAAGYDFVVRPPDESVEPEISDQYAPDELVARSSFLKAKHVAQQLDSGLVLAADTVAECGGQILGKPRDRVHAKEMLRLMCGREHRVLTGVTLWHRPTDEHETFVEQTILIMDELPDELLDKYLDSDGWAGKAGGFGYQDELGWIHIVQGSESNVVGLPMERLAEWIGKFATDL